MVRTRIIDAAVKVFAQKGFAVAGMDEIARRAGVAKGSLYYHFRSKSDLFAAVVSEGLAVQADRVLLFARGQIAEQGQPAALLRSGGLYSQLYRLQAEDYRMELS